MANSRSLRIIVLAVIAGLFALIAAATAKPGISDLITGPIDVEARPIEKFLRFGAGKEPEGNVTFAGGLVLKSSSRHFGGWSGLVLDDEGRRLLAISDTGVWMTGALRYEGTKLSGIDNARLGALLGRDGEPLSRGRDRDSEAVTLETGTLQRGSILVAFERRPRIARYAITTESVAPESGSLSLPPGVRRMRSNRGIEAIAVIRGGPFKDSLLALSERLYDRSRNHTGWLWTRRGPTAVHVTNIGDYDITDVASLEDGTLFLLERRFNWIEGVKMRLRRFAPGEIAPEKTAAGETLIEADLSSEIDNMEGLSVGRLANGDVRVTMISDDNFNSMLQRTVLLQFVVHDGVREKARLAE